MTFEVAIGGAVAIAATYFGWWLQKRQTKTQQAERERRLRALLVAEMSGNIKMIILSRKVETDFEEAEKITGKAIEHGPTETLLSKVVFQNLLSDLTFLQETTTQEIIEAYDWFDSVNLGVKAWGDATKPEAKQLAYEIWKTATKMAEERGYSALEALEATSEVARLRSYPQILNYAMSKSKWTEPVAPSP